MHGDSAVAGWHRQRGLVVLHTSLSRPRRAVMGVQHGWPALRARPPTAGGARGRMRRIVTRRRNEGRAVTSTLRAAELDEGDRANDRALVLVFEDSSAEESDSPGYIW